MELANFSEHLLILLFPILLSLVFTIAGACWINRLYRKEEDSSLLSFPEHIASRARFRKPLLFLLLTVCISKAWNMASGLQLFYLVIAIVLLSYVTVTDFEQYVIFDSMLLPFAVAGICYALHMQLPITEIITTAIGGGLLFFLLTLLTKGAIGGGDIKLIAALGLWLGIRPLLTVIMYGFLAGGAAAFFLLITKQKKRHDYFAYGPYFALSGIGVLLSWIHVFL